MFQRVGGELLLVHGRPVDLTVGQAAEDIRHEVALPRSITSSRTSVTTSSPCAASLEGLRHNAV
ncbi:hypothetical protein ACIREM_15560 [Streptomyces shenzhenensis]|uniref:hypothetical protein n=1 Tax=Streptomyces shenzhenensis TaxID=943815 RepID=UPI0037F9A714